MMDSQNSRRRRPLHHTQQQHQQHYEEDDDDVDDVENRYRSSATDGRTASGRTARSATASAATTRRQSKRRYGDGRRMKRRSILNPSSSSKACAPSSRYCMIVGVVVFCLLQVWIWIIIDMMDENVNGFNKIHNHNHNHMDDAYNMGISAFDTGGGDGGDSVGGTPDDDQIDDDMMDNSNINDNVSILLRRMNLNHRLGSNFVIGKILMQLLTSVITIIYPILEIVLGASFLHPNGQWLEKYDSGYFTKEQHLKPIVLIGGTDGSGTRAVVDLLRELGAMVVADDKETFDVHAKLLYHGRGWPGLVRSVLNQTHGKINYNYDHDLEMKDENMIRFDPSVRHRIDMEVRKNLVLELRATFDRDKGFYRRKYATRRSEEEKTQLNSDGVSFRPDQDRPHGPPLPAALRQGGIQGRRTTFVGLAKDISYVIKAPVSMLLWPVLTQLLASPQERRIKILHVVRDGRDIALSNNQSPVVKFFNTTYPHEYNELLQKFSGELEPVRGMKLWSDWNTQAMEWATAYSKNEGATVKVEYLWIRSEDLLPGSVRRREAIQALAEYVGSTLSNDQLCCLSKQKARDYGKSVLHNAETFQEQQQVEQVRHRSRYNNVVDRWKAIERNKWKTLRTPNNGTQEDKNDYGGDYNRLKQNYHHDHRRLLQQARKATGHHDKEHLIHDYESWKSLTEKVLREDARSAKVLAIEGLIELGHKLLGEYKEYKEQFVENGVTKKDIVEVIDNLRVFHELARSQSFHAEQSARKGDANVMKRFGKWHTVFDNHTNDNLVAHLYEEGSYGLEYFGYYPERAIRYPVKASLDDTIPCSTSTLDACPGA